MSRALPYHNRYHSDALRGMARLSLEQRGAYQLIMDLQYEAGEPIDDDDSWLAHQANTTPKKWRRVKSELVEAGKIVVAGGKISNPRATRELDRMDRYVEAQIASGRSGGKASVATRRRPNRVTSADTPQLQLPIVGGYKDTKANENNEPVQASLKPTRSNTNIDSSDRSQPAPQRGPPSPSIGGGPRGAPDPTIADARTLRERIEARIEAERDAMAVARAPEAEPEPDNVVALPARRTAMDSS